MTASAGARGIWPLATPPTSLSLTLARRSACRAATALGEGGGDSVKSIAPCAADPPVPHPSALPPPTSCTVLLRFAPPPAAHAEGSEGAGAGLCPGTEISLARTRSGSGGMMAAGGDLIISFGRWLPLGSDGASNARCSIFFCSRALRQNGPIQMLHTSTHMQGSLNPKP